MFASRVLKWLFLAPALALSLVHTDTHARRGDAEQPSAEVAQDFTQQISQELRAMVCFIRANFEGGEALSDRGSAAELTTAINTFIGNVQRREGGEQATRLRPPPGQTSFTGCAPPPAGTLTNAAYLARQAALEAAEQAAAEEYAEQQAALRAEQEALQFCRDLYNGIRDTMDRFIPLDADPNASLYYINDCTVEAYRDRIRAVHAEILAAREQNAAEAAAQAQAAEQAPIPAACPTTPMPRQEAWRVCEHHGGVYCRVDEDRYLCACAGNCRGVGQFAIPDAAGQQQILQRLAGAAPTPVTATTVEARATLQPRTIGPL